MNRLILTPPSAKPTTWLSPDSIAVILAAFASGNCLQSDPTGSLSVLTPFNPQPVLADWAKYSATSYLAQSDTVATLSPNKLDKPYPIAGRLVVIQYATVSGLPGGLADLGDFITLSIGSFATGLSILIGVSKSTLTDAYTPFGTYFVSGSYTSQIMFCDFPELIQMAAIKVDGVLSSLNLAPAPARPVLDALQQYVANGGVVSHGAGKVATNPATGKPYYVNKVNF